MQNSHFLGNKQFQSYTIKQIIQIPNVKMHYRKWIEVTTYSKIFSTFVSK